MPKKTFAQKLAAAKALGDQSDALNEEIVTEFLTAAAPVIQMLRDIETNMSDGVSFAARSKQVLQQIDVGLLKDPLSLRVVGKMEAARQAAIAQASSDAGATESA